MITAGIALVVGGVLLGAFGWWLNMNTPVQQRLPVVGLLIVLAGLFIAVFGLGRM